MQNSPEFTKLLGRFMDGTQELALVIFDLTSVNGNVFSLMGAFKSLAQRTEGWTADDIKIVLDECMSGDYDHAIQTLLAVTTTEEEVSDEDYREDEDDDDGYDDELAAMGRYTS